MKVNKIRFCRFLICLCCLTLGLCNSSYAKEPLKSRMRREGLYSQSVSWKTGPERVKYILAAAMDESGDWEDRVMFFYNLFRRNFNYGLQLEEVLDALVQTSQEKSIDWDDRMEGYYWLGYFLRRAYPGNQIVEEKLEKILDVMQPKTLGGQLKLCNFGSNVYFDVGYSKCFYSVSCMVLVLFRKYGLGHFGGGEPYSLYEILTEDN